MRVVSEQELSLEMMSHDILQCQHYRDGIWND